MGLAHAVIRESKFADIPAIVMLMQGAWSVSKYAYLDDIDIKEAKALLFNSIQRNRLKKAGGACVYVIDTENTIEGFIIGILDRVYHVGTKLVAHDVFYYAREMARPADKVGLLTCYVAWAKSCPDVVTIQNGITDVVKDTGRVEELYTRFGFRRSGVLMERNIG